MIRRLLFIVPLLATTLAFGASSAVADSSSGAAGWSLLSPGPAPSGDPAPDPNGDVTCSVNAPPSVPRDLVVPSGAECTVFGGTTIGRDLVVEQGGLLATGGITVGRDVVSVDPTVIEIGDFRLGSGRSFIGRDVNVTGGTSGVFLQEVCNATVGHDLIWQNLAPEAGLGVGDNDFLCFAPGTVYVGHDGMFLNNQNAISDISDNNPANGGGFGHDLIVSNNANMVVESNAIGHACVQQNNHPYTNDDLDSTGPNTAGYSIGSCNTPNP